MDGTLPDGTRIQFSVVTWPTENGPKETVLWDLLSQAWVIGYAIDHPSEYRTSSTPLAQMKLAGLRRDRVYLEGLGVKGMLAPSNVFMTWDRIDAEWRRQALARRDMSGRS
ncbi:MAG: hypothetical protein ACHQ50_00560 [Fimbriimonadales bacterium]